MVSERRESDRFGKGLRYAKKGDRDGRRGRRQRLASQALSPRESPMGSLCTGKRSRGWRLSRWGRCSHPDIHTLMTQELHELPPLGASLPISPQDGVSRKTRLRWFVERRGGDRALGMQHRTDTPWFGGLGPVPLTALP